MAVAKERTTTKTRMIQETYTEVEGVTLELTVEEAAFLAYVIGHKITGVGPARKTLSKIWYELADCGYGIGGKYYGAVTDLDKHFAAGYMDMKG